MRWPAEAIWEAVYPLLPGFTVEVLPSIDSSNSELMRRLRGQPGHAAQSEPVLLVAETQTAGRGRLGRAWHSRRGDSLMFSLSLPFAPVDWSGLSLVVGISIAETLDAMVAQSGGTARPHGSARIRLKWPNDLWLSTPAGDRKLAGILVETANGASGSGTRHVVIGAGINIRAPEATAADPQAVAPSVPAGGLQDVWPEACAADVLGRIVPPLVQALQAFEQFGFAPFQSRFAARDALAGRDVKLSDGTTGSAHGVGEDGALLVHTEGGMKQITSSEVSVRPMPLSTGVANVSGGAAC
ncbi:MAG: biotin--[acetyl-CoA-carboxylase] ligase [Comamonadaceae bacterium]|nr:MAG: biotin--[acetyl-CoA-carboxylase] ligase [Comamonadaceae bacterium]